MTEFRTVGFRSWGSTERSQRTYLSRGDWGVGKERYSPKGSNKAHKWGWAHMGLEVAKIKARA